MFLRAEGVNYKTVTGEFNCLISVNIRGSHMDKSSRNTLFQKYQSGKGFYGNVHVFLSLIGLIIPFTEIGMRSVKLGFWERLTLLEAMIGIILFLGLTSYRFGKQHRWVSPSVPQVMVKESIQQI